MACIYINGWDPLRQKFEKENMDFAITASWSYWRPFLLWSLQKWERDTVHHSCPDQPHVAERVHLFPLVLVFWQLHSRFHVFPSAAFAVSHKFRCGVLFLLLNSKYCSMLLASWCVTQNAVAETILKQWLEITEITLLLSHFKYVGV